ncbi:MAG: bifunctional phosphoribosyl-AMP cyclohydrolase/phosphoribosyl-ATP diphosphatase HisIE [Clostridiales bacterium]|nr:bifunctional phosphoribosyl-AMP cyclohydrolase/phosphoribosyl-ATP diphosphatase HisIE [Clostridiales bacterium]
MAFLDEVKFDENGLVPVITQDEKSGQVLMLAYANKEALELSASTKKMYYFSRSRQKLWLKGETSGHFQSVKSICYDCDQDAILAIVDQTGPACHTGNQSCFYRSWIGSAPAPFSNPMYELADTVKSRAENPKEGSYTNYLLTKGIDKILKKVGEESAETIIAAKNANKEEIALETADLLYHLTVMLRDRDVPWQDVFAVLEGRRKD